MTRTVVIANDGQTMASLTKALVRLDGVQVVRHLSGRVAVESLVRKAAPALVVLGEMRWPALAMARIAEVRHAAPAAALLVSYSDPEADWLAEALRCGATAVLPDNSDELTFALVIREALAGISRIAPATPPANAEPGGASIRRLRPYRRRDVAVRLVATGHRATVGDFEPPPTGSAA